MFLSEHGFKYRLVFARDGQHVVGCGNERGKGEPLPSSGHRQRPNSKDAPTLLDDFMREVEASK